MDLSEVGNHVFLGLQPETTLSDKDKRLLNAVSPAGVILFKSNFIHGSDYEAWLDNQRRLIIDIKAAAGRDKMFIATDHEGARVCRTPPPVTRFKSASEWAPKARQIGAAMGNELASLGINMNFAPVMDIHTNPDNPVIGTRAFGSVPDLVGACGEEFINGIHSENVWACAKHFPGHGDTDVDSHYDLPTLNLSKEDLTARELIPFKKAVDCGIRIIMTGHILYPQIDPDYPATLSPKITTGLLRQQLGYQGVVVSDDIGMHAMDRYFDTPAAACNFLMAGNDMLMICAHFTDTDRILGLASGMKDALKDDAFRQQVHEPSVTRVDQLLTDTTMHDVTILPAEQFVAHAQIDGVHGDQTAEVM
ncbi:MAG: beta-N-acetylhexosaminidase [Rhizobiaceae bacterium]|nr:beta-N-acetylhexosaminidase [Rhizobiaceae bacterium]